MFGKGAGGYPTASSLLSDITALRHDYRYEYKKTAFTPRPVYTTDIPLKIYARFSSTDLRSLLPWKEIHEEYRCGSFRYLVGEIMLTDLLRSTSLLQSPDIFLCNIPYFFAGRDDLPAIIS
jgi:homoserine dehydrogenase